MGLQMLCAVFRCWRCLESHNRKPFAAPWKIKAGCKIVQAVDWVDHHKIISTNVEDVANHVSDWLKADYDRKGCRDER